MLSRVLSHSDAVLHVKNLSTIVDLLSNLFLSYCHKAKEKKTNTVLLNEQEMRHCCFRIGHHWSLKATLRLPFVYHTVPA